jgi:O-antigen ligase
MFDKQIENLLNYFVFFLVFPCIDIVGNSITFYIFILILLRTNFEYIKWNRYTNLFILFAFFSIISSILSPEMERHPGIFSTLLIIIQYTYWVIIGVFFIQYYKFLNFYTLSKVVFIGLILSIISYYFIPFRFNTAALDINLNPSRNAFVFTLLASIPISFIYINQYKKAYYKIFFVIIFTFSMLFTNGRSGGVLIFLEIILISLYIFPEFVKTFRIATLVILLFSILMTVSPQGIRQDFANVVGVVNPRLKDLILAEEGDVNGDLSLDRSWLHRVLMIDKSIEIFKIYPVFGIGPNNFLYFDSELATLDNYERLGNETLEWYNNRSAHNSYIQVLSEMGIVGLIVFILILLKPLVFFIKKLINGNYNINLLPFIGLIGISFHFYAISSLTGAIPWFLFGILWGYIKNNPI